ncbi:hypothetical protein [Escherichia coli]|uniref:hypothetical protein n=1 Tax=Escherichia coli TaxID=562 RepID=UPI00069ACC1E|nr:hypothetical protein [Escherichia coli]
MDSVHHIWCPLFSQEFQDLPDGAETTLTLLLESRNPKWSQEQQNSFKWLAALLEEKYAGEITISAESSVNQ